MISKTWWYSAFTLSIFLIVWIGGSAYTSIDQRLNAFKERERLIDICMIEQYENDCGADIRAYCRARVRLYLEDTK